MSTPSGTCFFCKGKAVTTILTIPQNPKKPGSQRQLRQIECSASRCGLSYAVPDSLVSALGEASDAVKNGLAASIRAYNEANPGKPFLIQGRHLPVD